MPRDWLGEHLRNDLFCVESMAWHIGKPQPRAPQFSTHVSCGQTAGWIKMLLGTEVGLDPGDIGSDGDPALPPPQKGHSSPSTLRPML